MSKGRLEAFSDGVIAVIITIMVLELKPPDGAQAGDLRHVVPHMLSYVLSFVYVGIYWNNHHHLLHAAKEVDGRILWANLNLLFWLSLIPFTTAWAGQFHLDPAPVALYGVVLLMAGLAYFLLARALVVHHGMRSTIGRAIGYDMKGKVSLAIYAVAIPLAYVTTWIALALYVVVAAMWLVPDRRIEKKFED